MIVQASEPDGSDSWQPFPIGMSWHFGFVKDGWNHVGEHTETVLCSIGSSTDMNRRPSGINRTSILETLAASGIHNTELTPDTYFFSLPQYKFVISPEGNGIDCHRHYEALMAGAIPIIEDRPEIREKYRGCPILYTTDYSEITESYLQSVYDSMIDTEYDFSPIFWKTYPAEQQLELKYRGNFWMKRFFREMPMWYK
jgi:hypothetical protein